MVLIDASVWVALMNRNDSQHQKAFSLSLEIFWNELEILDHAYAETLNVLRRKATNKECRIFTEFLEQNFIAMTTVQLPALDLANKIFFAHPKLSFTDALLIATAKLYGHEILSFDENLLRVWQRLN